MQLYLMIDFLDLSGVCPPNHGRHHYADDGDDPEESGFSWPGWAGFFDVFLVFDHEVKVIACGLHLQKMEGDRKGDKCVRG